MPRDFLPIVKDSQFRSSVRKGKESKVGNASPAKSNPKPRVPFWSPPTFAWSMVAASIVATIITTIALKNRGATYQTASAPTNGAVVVVRFVAQATPADITGFLGTYKASVIREPRGVGFYRVRVSDARSQEELSKLVARMAQEKVVDFIAVEQ
jgi:hypothetical protein